MDQQDPQRTDSRSTATDVVAGTDASAEGASLPFPVVGIGASAGGIEALEAFFQGAGTDSGIAYVVIQHLSPEHQSLMASILARHTRMPVRQIHDGMAVEPNNVYVIAPGYTLTLGGGRLHLGEPVERPGHRRPVDDFLRSLAEEQRDKAIAVILSGTGTNGTAGAQAIKAAGGLCVAQSPESAAFPGMPRSLIHAGYADQVLGPREIPAIIERYVSRTLADDGSEAPAAANPERDQAHLREILAILRTRTRHDFSGYRKPTLIRRIQRRMGLNAVYSLGEYAGALRENTEEVSTLANDLMINVTGFFRDPEAWEALRTAVIAPLVSARKKGDEPIRCWVAACASGEEAYTLAILIAEELHAQDAQGIEVKIFATDTADKSLALARSGVFPGGIESDLTPERLERFFDRDEHTYRVKKEVRDIVVFAPQDVLRDPPFSRIDVCTCRNLLIYLEPEAQRRVLAMLHFSLRDGGHLFLGNTESCGGSEHLFEVISKRWRICRRTALAQQRFPHVPDFSLRPQPDRLVETSAATPARPSATILLQRALLERYGPPTVIVDRGHQVIYFHGATDAFLQQPVGEPTRDLLELVRPSLRPQVRTALRTAIRENRSVSIKASWQGQDGERFVEITAEPVIQGKSPEYFLVSFRQITSTAVAASEEPATAAPLALGGEGTSADQTAMEEIGALRRELQSSNEELETGKEELQSVNEELTTLNNQLQIKILQLEASTNDLANLLGSTDIAVVFLDSALRVRRFTPAVNDLLDLIESDIGRPVTDLAQKFTDLNLLNDARGVLQRLIPVEREIRSHSGRWYLRRTLPYRTPENRIEGVVVTFIDIGARKQAEREIVAARESLRAALEQMPVGVVIIEAPSGELRSANRRAEDVFGSPLQSLNLQGPAAFVRQASDDSGSRGRAPTPAEWPLARTLATGEAINDEEIEIVRANGERATLSVSTSPVRDAEGQTVAIVGIFADTTQRGVSERAMGEALRQFRLLVDGGTDFAVFFVEADGTISSWNRGAERILGWTEQEIVGRNLAVLFTDEDRAAGVPERELREAHETGRVTGDRWYARQDGVTIWSSGTLTKVQPTEGASSQFVKIIRDMTEHKQTEDRLRAAMAAAERAQAEALTANAAKDDFIATMSHELRTPLNTIRLWARMLASGKVPEADRMEGIRLVERAAMAQQQLIDDLLDVSRIASGKLRISLRATRLGDAIKGAVEAIRPVSSARAVQLKVEVAPDIGVVRADPERIQQVVWNLLSNAVKFTPSSGAVSVRARRVGEDVEIRIRDTGIGIRPEFLPLVFDRFRQAEAGTARGHAGLGLGLAIAKQLIEMHYGTISVASEGPGMGTEFTIRLPLPALNVAQAIEDHPGGTDTNELSGTDILLVEDEAAARDTTRRLLETNGAVVRAVETAASAREAIMLQLPDVIVSDIGLPGEDGYALLRSVRAMPGNGFADVPALALTAFARPEDRQHALEAGFTEHLSKPVDPDELLRVVARLARGDK